MSLSTIGLVASASLFLALTPGPDMLYIATRSVAQGRSAGVVSALGVQVGALVHTLAAALGLSALIAASALAFGVVKYAGAAYLIYLGIKTLLSKGEALQVSAHERTKLRDIFYQGLITNILNPKVIIFFLAFLPQFVDPSRGNVTLQFISLGVLLTLIASPVNVGVGLAGGQLSAWLKTRRDVQKASKWVTGSVFIGLGIGTALTGTRKA